YISRSFLARSDPPPLHPSPTRRSSDLIQFNEDGYFNGRRLLMQGNQGARLIDMPGSDFMWLTLFNSLITGNAVSQQLLRAPDMESGYMRLYHLTIADNAIGAASVIQCESLFYASHSFIWQPGKLPLAPGSDFAESEYVISNDSTHIGGIVAPPRFVDPDNGNFRLR